MIKLSLTQSDCRTLCDTLAHGIERLKNLHHSKQEAKLINKRIKLAKHFCLKVGCADIAEMIQEYKK